MSEVTPVAPITETKKAEDPKFAEGKFSFSNYQKERGAARVENNNGELSVIMVAPMEGHFQGGKRITTQTPEGKIKDVLDICLVASSPKNTEEADLVHLQLDRDSINGLLAAAEELGILSRSESKWVPGGKMQQLVRFALDLDSSLGK